MSKWTKEEREQMKERVKSALIRKPRISQYELAKVLGIDKNTALKLKKAVIKENTKWISDQKVEEEVGKIESEYDQLTFECWQIIKEIGTENKDKLSAMRALIEAKKTLFNIKFDSGIFKRKLGEIEIGKTLTQEEQDLIDKAIELNYGKKPKPKPDKANGDGGGNKSEKTGTDSGEDKT